MTLDETCKKLTHMRRTMGIILDWCLGSHTDEYAERIISQLIIVCKRELEKC